MPDKVLTVTSTQINDVVGSAPYMTQAMTQASYLNKEQLNPTQTVKGTLDFMGNQLLNIGLANGNQADMDKMAVPYKQMTDYVSSTAYKIYSTSLELNDLPRISGIYIHTNVWYFTLNSETLATKECKITLITPNTVTQEIQLVNLTSPATVEGFVLLRISASLGTWSNWRSISFNDMPTQPTPIQEVSKKSASKRGT